MEAAERKADEWAAGVLKDLGVAEFDRLEDETPPGREKAVSP